MITMKEFMELVDYRITEGSKYGWECYGPNAYMLDSWNGEQDGYSFTIIFDTKNHTVYEVQAHDYVHNRAYRMFNEDFLKKMKKEAKRRNVSKKEAWDDIEYVDLAVDDDFIQKSLAIKAGEDYDTDVLIPLDLPDDLLLLAFKQAHIENMTFNDWINKMLRDFVDKVEKGQYNKNKADADKFKKEHYNYSFVDEYNEED